LAVESETKKITREALLKCVHEPPERFRVTSTLWIFQLSSVSRNPLCEVNGEGIDLSVT